MLAISLFFHSDCGFDHVIYTLSDAKFHGEVDGVYYRSKCSRVMDHSFYRVGFAPMVSWSARVKPVVYLGFDCLLGHLVGTTLTAYIMQSSI